MSQPALRVPKLILHIGMYKTGTTSIQQFLCTHEAELERARILYPKACRHMKGTPIWGHHAVAAAVAALGKSDDGSRLWQSPDMAQLRAEALACSPQALLLSAEDFCSLENPALLAAAIAAEEVLVLMCVRNQADFVNAMYYTMVGLVQAALTPAAYLGDKLLGVLDYHRIASRWKAAFPAARVVVQSYDKGSPARQDAVRNFVVSAGLGAALNVPAQRASRHSTLPACATRLLYEMRVLGVPNDEFMTVHKWAHRVYADKALGRSRECIAPARIAAIADSDFEVSNRLLRREFMDGVDASPFAAPAAVPGAVAEPDYFAENGLALAVRQLILDGARLGRKSNLGL